MRSWVRFPVGQLSWYLGQGQLSLPSLEYRPSWLELRRGAFSCVGWLVILCDPIWQVMHRSSEMASHEELYAPYILYLRRTVVSVVDHANIPTCWCLSLDLFAAVLIFNLGFAAAASAVIFMSLFLCAAVEWKQTSSLMCSIWNICCWVTQVPSPTETKVKTAIIVSSFVAVYIPCTTAPSCTLYYF